MYLIICDFFLPWKLYRSISRPTSQRIFYPEHLTTFFILNQKFWSYWLQFFKLYPILIRDMFLQQCSIKYISNGLLLLIQIFLCKTGTQSDNCDCLHNWTIWFWCRCYLLGLLLGLFVCLFVFFWWQSLCSIELT